MKEAATLGGLLWTPSGWEWLPVAAGAVVVYEVLRGLVLGAVRRSNEARVDRFLHENRIPTDVFRYTHRVAVREMVLGDPGLAAAVAERAQQEGVSVADVQARVRTWLNEILPHFNLLAYYRVGYVLARLAAYSVYHVRLDAESLRRAQARIPEGAAVVYVSNHRSNADFIVTGFMLSKSVQVSYAVGEWARVWPLEKLFKSFGSYFVRRGEKDPLYHRTLQAYVQLVTKQGVTQAMFPEGGLSRDGRLRPMKLGLLDTMARTKLDPGFDRPLVFVPVGIDFDRVFEDEVLVREARGEAPFRRRTAWQKARRLAGLARRTLVGVPVNTVRFLTKRMKKHGVAAIHFGEPVVFDDWYATQAPFLDDPDRRARWARLRPFGEELMRRIGRAVPVTPVPLACEAARRIGRGRMEEGVDRATFLLALRDVLSELQRAGAPIAVRDPYDERDRERRRQADRTKGRHGLLDIALDMADAENLERLLRMATDVTARRGILLWRHGRFISRRWDLVSYYANAVAPHLEPAAPPRRRAVA